MCLVVRILYTLNLLFLMLTLDIGIAFNISPPPPELIHRFREPKPEPMQRPEDTQAPVGKRDVILLEGSEEEDLMVFD